MRMLAIYHKTDSARFVSHLDVQRTLHRAFRRAKLPLHFSEGFNPHPELSFASALPTGATSDAEWFEVELDREMTPEAFLESVNAVMPKGFFLSDARPMPGNLKTLTNYTRFADYSILVETETPVTAEAVEEAVNKLLSGEIIVDKKTKSGIKPVDIRPQIVSMTAAETVDNAFFFRVIGTLTADGGLRIELLMRAFFERLGVNGSFMTHRNAIYFDLEGVLPGLPKQFKE